MLADRTVDLVVRASSDQASPDVASIPLARSPLIVACNANHDLADEPAVGLAAWSASRWSATRAAGKPGTWLVSAGLGATVIPNAIAPRGQQLRHIAIDGPRWVYTIAAQTLAPWTTEHSRPSPLGDPRGSAL